MLNSQSELIVTYLLCLDNFPGMYVNESKATELIDLHRFQLDFDKLRELFPKDTKVGKLVWTKQLD